jgi:AraC-like DNA-binding protein
MWEGLFLFIGEALETHTHEHHAVQIIISIDNPFRMKGEGEDWKEFTSLVIDSDKPHECIALNSRIIFISIEPESLLAKQLKDFVKSPYHPLPDTSVNSFILDLDNKIVNSSPCSVILSTIQQFINTLTMATMTQFQIDDRVKQTIHIIKNSLDKKITLKHLAKEVYLSESRLVHLFKEQVGIPIRKYILWSRLNLAAKQIIEGVDFTQAAHHAGFSDSAHFSRTFTRMFGITPSDIFKNSQNIQAHICSD